jgi:hypothetical protein
MNRWLSPVVTPVAVMLVVVLSGCGRSDDDVDIAGQSIRYEVSYSAYPPSHLVGRAIGLSYSNDDGQQDRREVALPWNAVVDTAPAGFVASVKAQFYGYGTITCRILAGDKVIRMNTSPEGTYPTVECQA